MHLVDRDHKIDCKICGLGVMVLIVICEEARLKKGFSCNM
ncbi:hypothetical protein [Clostridium sp. 'deep sea']|nr:hypothetical protein [Clostridium sp. 'deep sea']